MGKKIAVRFGHMANVDQGANGIISELSFDREYGTEVISWLKIDGNEVINVTPITASNMGDSLAQGVNKANDEKADLFVSLHGNAFNGTAHGTEVVAGSQLGVEIGSRICLALAQLGFTNRGAYIDRRGLYEIHKTNMTAIIIEPLFVDSSSDVDTYKKMGARAFARAIAEGIIGHSIQEPVPTPVTVVNNAIITPAKAANNIDSEWVKGLVKELQIWMNRQGITDKYGHQLTEDGIPGDLTNSALDKLHVYPGDRSVFVAWVQKRLKITIDSWYANPKVAPFYHETWDAIRNFQSSRRLVIDGYAGPATFKELVK